MKKLVVAIPLLLFLHIALAFDVFPDRLAVYTNQPYFDVKVMIRNTDANPVVVQYKNQSVVLNPNEIKTAVFKVKYGDNLVLEAQNEKHEIEIKWFEDARNFQVPEISGWMLPIRWANHSDVHPPDNSIKVPKVNLPRFTIQNTALSTILKYKYLVAAVVVILVFAVWLKSQML